MDIHFPERVFSDILDFMHGFYILYNKDGDIIKRNQSVPRSFPKDLDDILLSSAPCLDETKSDNFKMYTDTFQSYTIYIYNYDDYNYINGLGWLVVGFLHQNELIKLLDIVSIGVMKFDLSFKPIYLNINSENIFGHSQDELWNMGFERIFGRSVLINFQEHIDKNPYLTQPFETVTNTVTPLGRKKVLSVKIYSIYEYSISSIAYYTVISDITQEYNSNLKLRYLANHDSLTNLHNRSALIKEITEAVQTQDIKQSALLYVDADEFKAINDTYGHNTGDEVLKYIASQLVSSSNSGDIVARVEEMNLLFFFIMSSLQKRH